MKLNFLRRLFYYVDSSNQILYNATVTEENEEIFSFNKSNLQCKYTI